MSEQVFTVDTSPKESESNKVGVASSEAIERGELRKRGRHKKDCLCANCVARRSEQPEKQVKTSATVASVPPIDAEVIKQTFGDFLRSIDEISCRKIYFQTLKLTNDNKAATELADSCKIRDSEILSMTTCVGVIAQKYQLAGKYLPEAILAISMTVYISRHVSTHAKIAQLAKDNLAAKRIHNNQPATETDK